MCHGIEKWRNLHICQDMGLIFLKFGGGGYFWILNPKSRIQRHSNVKMKWRYITYISLAEIAYGVIMMSPFVRFFENVNLSSSYDRLSPQQIWFNLDQGNQSYGGGGGAEWAESALPGWECIKSPRWDRVRNDITCNKSHFPNIKIRDIFQTMYDTNF